MASDSDYPANPPTPTSPPYPDGVPDWAWDKIARVEGSRWAISERNAAGEIIGTAYRDCAGGKAFKPGGKRGLIVMWPLGSYAGTSAVNPVFVCEGASDTAALLGLGLDAVGVPMAGQCGDMLTELLADLHVVIVADADDAGRRGANKLAAGLLTRCPSVRIIEPPEKAKDARAAVIAGANAGAFRALVASTPPMVPGLGAGSAATGSPIIRRVSDVLPEPVQWLWPGRFALGKLTILAGDPGLGKSFLTLDIAARVSRGAGWPDAPGVATTPGGVVLLSAEDDVADTIRPRLEAAGANLHRISVLDAIMVVGDHASQSARVFDLSRDLPALEQAIQGVPECQLVVIDPITAYLGSVDSHKNADIRGLLAPLSQLAAKHGVAVVAVTHLNKNGGGAAIYRTMGSLAFTAAARAAWAVSKDKNLPTRRLLLPIKSNIAPDTGGLAYRIQADGVSISPVVVWEPNPVNVSADDALAGERGMGGGRTERDAAADWLRDFLADGPKLAKEVESESEAAGFKKRTIERAKAAVGIVPRKDGFGGGWVWALPGGTEDRQAGQEDRHTPDFGNLRAKPDESREICPKTATPVGLASFDGASGIAEGTPAKAGGKGEHS